MIQTIKINKFLNSASYVLIFFLGLLFSVSFFSSVAYANLANDAGNSEIIEYACGELRSEGTSIYNVCVNNTETRLNNCSSLTEASDRILCRRAYIAELNAGENRSPDGIRQESEQAQQEREAAARQPGSFEGTCEDSLDPDDCGITALIRQITDALLVLVGIVVVMMIIIGGIQYSAAGSNPQAVAAAKKKISQALFALVIYLFMGAFLQWLIPGGIF